MEIKKITEWIQMKRQSNDTISRESYKSNEDESQEDNMNIDIRMNKVLILLQKDKITKTNIFLTYIFV